MGLSIHGMQARIWVPGLGFPALALLAVDSWKNALLAASGTVGRKHEKQVQDLPKQPCNSGKK